MQEIHGIADADRIKMVGGDLQSVTVIDGRGYVLVRHSCNEAAGLTPQQARFLAKQIIASADRVERASLAAKVPSPAKP